MHRQIVLKMRTAILKRDLVKIKIMTSFFVEKSGHKLTVYVRKSKNKLNQGVIPTLFKKRVDEFDEEGKNHLLFGNAIEGSDLEYSVTGNGIKENKKIKEKSAVYRYPFIIECENVTVAHNESEKQVLFKDKETGADIFCIPAPFMYDVKGKKSSSVTYEVKELSQDKVAFTVIADSDWINTAEREIPVVLDSQITISGSNAISTYGWCDGLTANENIHTIGTVETCECGCCCSSVNRMYMNFTMPSLSFNPRIRKAELIVKQASGYVQRGVSAKLGLYRLKSRAVIGCNTSTQEDALL